MSTPRSYELSLSSYPGARPPCSSTSIVKVATAPSTARRQCRYSEGCTRKSTGPCVPFTDVLGALARPPISPPPGSHWTRAILYKSLQLRQVQLPYCSCRRVNE